MPAPAARERTGATGIFPAAYVPPSDQESPDGDGYPAQSRRGRGRDRRPPSDQPRPRRLIDYPRWGRQGWTRWLPSWKLILGLMVTGFVMVVVALYAAYLAIALPPEDAETKAQSTTIYYKDGKTPISELAIQNRQNVTLEQVPDQVERAVLAAEDRTFETNSGVDPTSIARAIWSNVRGNSLQGGSTISQQYVKNVYDERDLSKTRKFKEIFRAVKINQELGKEKILERYLNTIYFGRGAYGIQAATQAYFGDKTDVSELTVSQGAFLAGIINAPEIADPRDSDTENARAQRRWGVVLDAMVEETWLDQATRSSLEFPKVVKEQSSVTVGQNGYLRDMVVAEALEEHGLDEDDLKTGGYKIVTTFDKKMVNAAVKAVKTMLPKDKPKGVNIGLSSIDPSSGAVRAIYGGPKYTSPDLNNATIAQAQAGSTFKAFGLIAALEDGVSLKTAYNSDSPVTVGGARFDNTEEKESSGFQDLVVATKMSLNTVFAQLNYDVGPEKIAEAAYAAGLPKSLQIDDVLSNVLGPASPHAIDMAGAYATFASGGIQHTPYTIQSISEIGDDSKESYNADGETKGERVFKADTVTDLTYALKQVVKDGTGTYAQRLSFPVAGKTGTSSGSRSAWFVGYNSELSTSVVMYQLGTEKVNGKKVASNVEMEGFGEFSEIFGGGYPLRVWTAFMEKALAGKDVKPFADPVFTGEITNSAPVITPSPTAAPSVEPEPSQTTPETQPTEATTPPETEPTFEDPDPEPSASASDSASTSPTFPGNDDNDQ